MSVKSDLWTNLPAKLVLSPCTHIQRVFSRIADESDGFASNGRFSSQRVLYSIQHVFYISAWSAFLAQ